MRESRQKTTYCYNILTVYICVALKVTVLTPCFPRFEVDYHGVFVKELCDNLSDHVPLSVLAPRSKTLGQFQTSYPVERFPYLPRQGWENLPEATMKDAPVTRLMELPFYIWAAHRSLRNTDSSLVHAHLAIPLGFVASLTDKPYLVTCHGSDLTLPMDRKRYLPLTWQALRKASKVVTVSRYLEALAWKLGANPEKTETIYLGVDTQRFTPRKKNGPVTIGTLGRLVPSKNIEDLIDATKLLQSRYDFHLKIGGDGPLRCHLEEYASSAGLDSYEFTGVVSDPVNFHQSLDVFVLCSTREGLSLSLQEAMSCGVVPVAVDACGCDELIERGVNGFLFEPGNVDELAQKLEDAIHSNLGARARQTMTDGFDSKKGAGKYIELYEELGHRF
jgi:glycosyltransferase involved in cell wall biosynthesis